MWLHQQHRGILERERLLWTNRYRLKLINVKLQRNWGSFIICDIRLNRQDLQGLVEYRIEDRHNSVVEMKSWTHENL